MIMTSREALSEIKELEKYMKDNRADDIADMLSQVIPIIEKDLEVLDILKNHMIVQPVIGMGTERYKDVAINIFYEDDDNDKVLKWLEKCKKE